MFTASCSEKCEALLSNKLNLVTLRQATCLVMNEDRTRSYNCTLAGHMLMCNERFSGSTSVIFTNFEIRGSQRKPATVPLHSADIPCGLAWA